MHARVHHEVSPVVALDGVAHLRNFLLFDLQSRAQAVCASNFLHRVCGNSKQLVRHGEQNYRFRPANPARFCRLLRCDLHHAPTGTSLENFITRLSMAALISFISTTSSTAPVLIASAGMPKITEDASSCAITYPLLAF